jgi:sulfide:quinone oxidoreductase
MRVLIAGGGVAGLEALLALSILGCDLVEVELICPDDSFVLRPMLVAEPFGVAEVLRLDLKQVATEAGVHLVKDALATVDPGARTISTGGGKPRPYDALIVAVGAKPVEAVPGALTFGDAEQRQQFGGMLKALGRRGAKGLAFVVPRGVSWSIAAYELALLTAAERDVRRIPGVELVVVTHESAPLEALGAAASQLVVARLEEAGVSVQAAKVAERVEDGVLVLASGETLGGMGFVALPTLEVGPIPGLPQRTGGFVQTDARMQVAGLDSVWAAGDVTWFPVKQGGLAAQQADVAARAVAAAAGAHVPIEPFHPVLRAALITGGAPDFVRADRAGGKSTEATAGRALWWPPTKVAGKYLGPYVARKLGEEPGADELVDLPPPPASAGEAAEHELATSLVLAAADADAAAEDFEGALKWLAFAEQLDFVLSPQYVTHRYEWRRRLDPGLDRTPPLPESTRASRAPRPRCVTWSGASLDAGARASHGGRDARAAVGSRRGNGAAARAREARGHLQTFRLSPALRAPVCDCTRHRARRDHTHRIVAIGLEDDEVRHSMVRHQLSCSLKRLVRPDRDQIGRRELARGE